ncbi:MAG: VanZ family protein [Lachnospiraceae bacterium]|nr:VanZ family protein [Lachnospiraceae bacterium]
MDRINTKWFLRHIAIWIPAICIMFIIFNFSSMAADDSSNTSIPIAELVMQKIGQFTGISFDVNSEGYDLIHHRVRKAGHFLEYMALGCTLILPFAFICEGKSYYKLKVVFCSELFSACYACTDEFHQIFVDGRDGNLADVGIDSLGALAGICAGLIFWWIGKRIIKTVHK